MFISFENPWEKAVNDIGEVNELQQLHKRLLELHIQSTILEGQLDVRGQDRHPDDAAVLGAGQDELFVEYKPLVAEFQSKLAALNTHRKAIGQPELELHDPTDEEVRAEMDHRLEQSMRRAA